MTGPDRLVVVSGPAGVGKSTVVSRVRAARPDLWLSVSATTRPIRPGEVDGVSYHFVTPEQFQELVDSDALLEHAEYAGNRYGTPRRPVQDQLDAGRPVLLEIEIEGARQVRRLLPQARLVFLAPPSWEELERRLRGRGTESPEVIRRRLDRARVELGAEAEFDVTVVNTSVDAAADTLAELVR